MEGRTTAAHSFSICQDLRIVLRERDARPCVIQQLVHSCTAKLARARFCMRSDGILKVRVGKCRRGPECREGTSSGLRYSETSMYCIEETQCSPQS